MYPPKAPMGPKWQILEHPILRKCANYSPCPKMFPKLFLEQNSSWWSFHRIHSCPCLALFSPLVPPFTFLCGIERRKAVVPLGLLGSVVPHTVPPFQTDRVTCPREAQARPICYFIFPPFLFRVRVRSTKIYISQPVIIYRLKPQHNFIQLNCITCSF